MNLVTNAQFRNMKLGNLEMKLYRKMTLLIKSILILK